MLLKLDDVNNLQQMDSSGYSEVFFGFGGLLENAHVCSTILY